MKNDELLHKWINNTISPEELETFKLRPEYDSLVELYSRTENLEVSGFEAEEMLAQILANPKPSVKTTTESETKARSTININSRWIKYGIAASLAILLCFIFWPESDIVNYQVASADQLEGTLPDQSVFTLNADSKLSYNRKTWKEKRELQLEGEAYFDVRTGQVFTVYTTIGRVEVLGTQFNVRSRNDELQVACHEGSVAVFSLKDGESDTLRVSEGITISSSGVMKKWTDPSSNSNSWTEGITKLRNTPFREVMKELERQFDITIETVNIDLNEKISCNFQHENLDLALKTATSPLNIRYQLVNPKLVKLSK